MSQVIKLIVIGALCMSQVFAETKIISFVDPRVLTIPIKENHEPMINLKEQHVIAFGSSPEVPDNTDYTKMRKFVYTKLVEAQKTLPSGLKFCLYEAYRSLQLQEKLFNDRYNKLKMQFPNWSNEKVFTETVKLVSPVKNLDGTHNIPPHSTGGTIDIYLVDDQGKPVDMGIEVVNWMNDVDGSLSKTHSEKISEKARQYRAIMSTALERVGFVNYLGEYWHWSYGDRYCAYHAKKPYAIYDSVSEQHQ